MKKQHWYKRLALCALAIPCAANSQEASNESPIDCEVEANQNLEECINLNSDGLVDEIVVTGTYLPRDQFTSPSPIDVITNIDVQESGAATIGEYLRDANYTLNASTINAGGGNGADTVLNLRGFGTDGTLTLVNGVRATTALDGNSLVPSIALQRAEVLLDGGGALYGADAIAGVVNLISAKKYEGFKATAKYNSDLGDYDDSNFQMMFGKSFDFLNLDFVQAFETQSRSTLSNTERPEYLRPAVSVSTNGNPGEFTGASSFFSSGTIIDPNCGYDFFNGTAQVDPGKSRYAAAGLPLLDDGTIATSYADLVANGGTCYFANGEQDDYLPQLDRYVSYSSIRMDLTDDIEMNYTFTISYREVNDPDPYTTGESDELSLPANHPALIGNTAFTNPGADGQYTATGWVPFGKLGTKPSFYNNIGLNDIADETHQYNHTVKFNYDFGDTGWRGETYASSSARTVLRDMHVLRTSRLSAAFQGLGGPNCGFDTDQLLGLSRSAALAVMQGATGFTPGANGCEYFNPLLSEALDPNLSNSPELLNWLHDDLRWTDQRTETRTWQTLVTGEIFDLPAGPINVAVGYNFRHVIYGTFDSYPEAVDDDFDGLGGGFEFDEKVQSPFIEIGIPILDNLDFTAAVRREEYKDRNFGAATIPKYSISYSPIEDLVIRASYSESFTAPSAQRLDETNPLRLDGFATLILDPFDDYASFFNAADVPKGNGIPRPQAPYFQTGNSELTPELSKTNNIGFTYRGLENWTFSLDLQEITYIGEIFTRRVGNQLTLLENQFDAAGGDYSDTQGVIDFLLANPIDGVTRDPNTGGIISSIVRPTNTPDDIIFRFGTLSISNRLDTSIGYFSTQFNTSFYDEYLYVERTTTTGQYLDAVGQRNDEVDESVAIPRFKSDLSVRWSSGNHRVVSRINYLHGVQFDGSDVTNFSEPPDRVDSFTTLDLRYSYNLANLYGGNANITVGATNLLDEKAQILPVRGGIEPALHDPFGRAVFVEMDYEF